MAIYGYGFCRSARDAFKLILRNVIRVFVVDKITDFVLFIGKLAVCALAGKSFRRETLLKSFFKSQSLSLTA